jgi:hypothetical protein
MYKEKMFKQVSDVASCSFFLLLFIGTRAVFFFFFSYLAIATITGFKPMLSTYGF